MVLGKNGRSFMPAESIKLVATEVNNDPSAYDDFQKKAIESLQKLEKASNNAELMRDLFNEVDEDGSGLIGQLKR